MNNIKRLNCYVEYEDEVRAMTIVANNDKLIQCYLGTDPMLMDDISDWRDFFEEFEDDYYKTLEDYANGKTEMFKNYFNVGYTKEDYIRENL